MKTKPEIKSNEYEIFSVEDKQFPVCVKNLDKQVMFTLFCKDLLKTVVANNIDLDKFAKIIKELIGDSQQKMDIAMRIVGGDSSKGTEKYLNDLGAKLDNFSDSKVKITVSSFDGGELLHPSAIEVDCYGGVSRHVDDMF